MNIKYTRKFQKQFGKLSANVVAKLEKRIDIFVENKHSRILHNHKLRGEHEGCRSINITGDIRAIYQEVDTDTVLFIAIGSHSELYER